MAMGWSYDPVPAPNWDAGEQISKGLTQGYNTGFLLSGVPAAQAAEQLRAQQLQNALHEQEISLAPQKLELMKQQIKAHSAMWQAYAEQRKETAQKIADQLEAKQRTDELTPTAEAMGGVPATGFQDQLGEAIDPGTLQFAAPEGTAPKALSGAAINQIRGFQASPRATDTFGVEAIRQQLQLPKKGEVMKLGQKDRLVNTGTGETVVAADATSSTPSEKDQAQIDLDKARLRKIEVEIGANNISGPDKERLKTINKYIEDAAKELRDDPENDQARARLHQYYKTKGEILGKYDQAAPKPAAAPAGKNAFNTAEEALNSGLPDGSVVTINGVQKVLRYK